MNLNQETEYDFIGNMGIYKKQLFFRKFLGRAEFVKGVGQGSSDNQMSFGLKAKFQYN